MTYNEIKGCIDKSRKDIMSIKKSLKSNDEEQASLKKSMLNVESTYQLNIRDEKDRALKAHVDQIVQPFAKQITELSESIQQTNESYQKELSELDNTALTANYSDEEAMAAEVRAALAVLQTQLSHAISPRFQSVLESQLDTHDLNIKSEDVDRIVRFFNAQSRNIAKMGNSSVLDRFIDNVLSIVRVPLADNNENTTKITYGVLTIFAVIVFFLSAKYIFPFYVAFLATLAVYNLAKNYKIYIALIAQKAVKDNLTLIETSLHDKALAKKEVKRKSICDRYDKLLLDLQKSLEEATQNKSIAENDAESSFTYDTAEAQERYQNAVKFNNSRMQALQKEHTDLLAQLQQRNQELSKFEQDLNVLAGGVQEEYLDFDKVGTDVIFTPKFIIDIKNAKPVYFQHPQHSCLFLYSAADDMNDLIKLLLIQLRIKFKPSNLVCSVIDIEGLGMQFLSFNTNDEESDETIKNLFKIITTAEEVKEHMSSYNDLVSKRIMTIRKSYDSIAEYNQAMVESASLTETYDFIFCLNPTSSTLTDDNFKKVYSNGGSLGIYSHIFIKTDDFYNMGDNAKFLIENAGGVYVLKDGAILKRAKEFALENLIKPSN